MFDQWYNYYTLTYKTNELTNFTNLTKNKYTYYCN